MHGGRPQHRTDLNPQERPIGDRDRSGNQDGNSERTPRIETSTKRLTLLTMGPSEDSSIDGDINLGETESDIGPLWHGKTEENFQTEQREVLRREGAGGP